MTDTVTIARICWEANRAYCAHVGHPVDPPWEAAAAAQSVQGYIDGVAFAIANPGSTPEDQHQAWMNAKILDGWRRGDVKDAAAKTHPALVPYVDLPEVQRVKDRLFLAIVRALQPQPEARPAETIHVDERFAGWMAEVGALLDQHVGKHPHRAVDWGYWADAYEAGKTPVQAVEDDMASRRIAVGPAPEEGEQ